jgi:hypothetical protein|tara:strand:+ start:1575 stop:2294 length:720 start_codon:yes stop_codon:yes gene_type:complete
MKNTLLIAVFLTTFALFAQNPYTVSDQDGEEVTEGMVITMNDFGVPDGSFDYFVTNDSDDDINMRIEFVSALNADGSGFELCFDQCFIDLVIGQSIPPPPNFVTILAGETTPSGNHFAATIESTEVQDYNFRFYLTDSEGVDIGNDLNFTYRYDPTLGLNDIKELGVEITSTVIFNAMEVNTLEEMNMFIYSLQGQLINSQMLYSGNQIINLSYLSPQVYIVKFKTKEGISKTLKIIKK